MKNTLKNTWLMLFFAALFVVGMIFNSNTELSSKNRSIRLSPNQAFAQSTEFPGDTLSEEVTTKSVTVVTWTKVQGDEGQCWWNSTTEVNSSCHGKGDIPCPEGSSSSDSGGPMACGT